MGRLKQYLNRCQSSWRAQRGVAVAALLASGLLLSACSPTVKVAPPSEPITINLNVKIEHEIRIKVEKELDNLFESNANIF